MEQTDSSISPIGASPILAGPTTGSERWFVASPKYFFKRMLGFAVCLILQPVCAQTQESQKLSEALNFHRVSDELLTAGQIYPAQVQDLQDQGVELVVNLAVADPERNGGESLAVTGAGISYVHIPVLWQEPTRGDLLLFFAMMDAGGDRKTLVHCFANYRASAFTFLYRVMRLNVPVQDAKRDLYAVWNTEKFEEFPIWKTFIEESLASEGLKL
ncbi:MAG: protein tyrosine phosphatase family protein [Pseudomonadota bacterium]